MVQLAATPLAARKKDLPSPDDQAGVRALLHAQELQAGLVARFRSGRATPRPRATLAGSTDAVDGGRMVWEPERCSCEGATLYANLYLVRGTNSTMSYGSRCFPLFGFCL